MELGSLFSSWTIPPKCLKPSDAKLFQSIISTNGRCKTQQRSKRREIHALNTNTDFDSFASISSALENCSAIKQLKQLHARILKNGLQQEVFLRTKLAAKYEEHHSMKYARLVFEKTEAPDVFFWNVIIRGYAKNGPYEEAIALYYKMLRAGLQPNKFTFPFVLKACAVLNAMEEGIIIHNHIRSLRFEANVHVGASLIDMYGKCGNTEDARYVFDKMPQRNLVAWTAMIAGYAQNGKPIEALWIFKEMGLVGMRPDSVAIGSAVLACVHLKALMTGKLIHGYILKCGYEFYIYVATGIIDMYAKCGSVQFARQVFDKMPQRNAVSWNAMISGYAQNGHAKEALALFKKMRLGSFKPDSVTMLCVLPECAHLGYLHSGEQIHCDIVKRGFESDVFVGNSLIDMYSRCGRLDTGRRVFDSMSRRVVVSWNAMITGYAINGFAEDAITLFSQMQESRVKPNHITFVSLLSACSHAGLADKAWQYFESMKKKYQIIPQVEHYACMVDLLGRTGHLVEAQDFIRKMPLEPTASIWGTLFHACRVHNNVEIGRQVAERLFELEPENGQCSVLLSNVYNRTGRWDDLKNVTMMRKDEIYRKSMINSHENRNHAVYV